MAEKGNRTFMSNEHLDQFRHFSMYTDPGEYGFLYDELPTTLDGINKIVHTQLIHPAAVRFGVKFTKEQEKDEELLTISKILAKLQERAPIGLSMNRRMEQRVVNNCRGHALLMASMLKVQGVPARLRCGFAPYLLDGFSCDHTVLEAWMEGRWRLMDADATNEFVRNRGYSFDVYDMSREMFDFGWQAWQQVRQNIHPIERYGIPGGRSGWPFLQTALIRDMLALFGEEVMVWTCPPFKNLYDDKVQSTLDKVARLMAAPDQNWHELKQYYDLIDVPVEPR
jgi:hypothetical protein